MITPPGEPDIATPTETEEIPTWRDLADRFRDVMRDIAGEIGDVWKKEGKELERELQSRLLPTLNRAKLELDRLIKRLEDRTAKLRP